MTQTFSDLPTDIHRLIFAHASKENGLKQENEKLKEELVVAHNSLKLKTSLVMNLLQRINTADESETDDESEWIEEEDLFQYTVKQLRSRLKDLGIKGFSNKNKPLLVERRPTLEGTYREFWMQKSRVWG